MRPRRIELEGFGSFRSPADIDLAEADLFVLSGATGSGKTTIVEAVVFALYGAVPRYDDRRLVAPVINQGRNEARVRLTFDVAGRTFQATRVVRRREGGATTKEARLEEVTGGGHQTVAGTADELTEAVQSVLGLDFDQFTRSVVLPQGAFDRFLFAKPADRADLLVQLLDLGVYDDVGRLARLRAESAKARVGELGRQLEGDLADATDQARESAGALLERLEALSRRCDEVQPQLDEIRDEGAELRQAATLAEQDRDALAALTPPDGLAELAAAVTGVRDRVKAADELLAAATEEVAAATQVLAGLPDPDAIAEAARVDLERDRVVERRRAAETALAETRAGAERAREAEHTALAVVAAARASLDAARRHELAQTLAAGLAPGDDCPVCGTTVADLPDHGEAVATDRAATELAAAEVQLDAARRDRGEADRAVTAAETTLSGLTDQEAGLARRRRELVDEHGLPDDASSLGELAAALAAARERDREARTREQRARGDRNEAAAELDRLDQNAGRLRGALDTARQQVARLDPPAVDHGDLAGAWAALLAWADEVRPRVDEAATAARAAVDDAVRRYLDTEAALRAECGDAGVEVPTGTTPAVAVAEAVATARHRLAEVDRRLEQAGQLRRALAEAQEQQAVASELGRHLRADAFERWLLARALRLLVAGASTILRDLSSGAYSLALDDTNAFLVVDHRNADEPRTARSLSGGERFLASLALALALAEHVAELAAEGAAKLESLFLDEGFGTLDAATLDTVAGAIEELGARGRMVGVVTHVRELAERLPVRFEVRQGPDGSSVARVDQDGDVTAGDGAAHDAGEDAA